MSETPETIPTDALSVNSSQTDPDQMISSSDLPAYEVPASAFRFCGSDGWPLDM